jgi:hypothetical protein
VKSALLVTALAGCGGGGSKAVDAATSDTPGDGACVARTIFLNRGGGTYSPGPDDATMNKSSVLDGARTIPPATTTDPDWTAVKACVAMKLAAYPVVITDVDPSPAQHVEVVVIDNGNQIGVPGLTAGAPPTPCAGGFGTAATNTIAYATWLGTNANHCWDISMAIGYTLGLDNVLTCADLMSPNPSCDIPSKAFTSVDQPCGQTAAMNCRCGGTTQNATARLTANLGASCP